MSPICPAALAALTALALLPAGVAVAHGPCDCLFPVVGKPGARVTVASGGRVVRRRLNWPAYKIVFNPRPSAYGEVGSDTGYAGAYRPSAPTATVFLRSKPVRGARFRVPRSATPGVYLVMIFDGSEGGQHYTWDYLHVLGPARSGSAEGRQRSGDRDGDVVPGFIGAAIATLVFAAIALGRRRLRSS